jgi:transposase
MKPAKIEDAEVILLALQDEIRRTEEARYDHRLHGVLLVAQGMTAPEVANYLGDSRRTVEYWVERFNQEGLAGLAEGERPGRPRRLSTEQLGRLGEVLRGSPRTAGLEVNLWDGKAVAEWLRQEYGVTLGVRQCQRLFRQLGFRLRKPRPSIAHADPVLQRAHKKTPRTGSMRRR